MKKVMKLKEKEGKIKKLEKAVHEKEKVIIEDGEILHHQKKWLNDKDSSIARLQSELERMKWNIDMETNKKRQWEEEEVQMRKRD